MCDDLGSFIHQKRVEIKEGQLAEKTIRANKNIEHICAMWKRTDAG